MRIIGSIPPPSKQEHERARIWAASGLAALALLMLMLLIGSPPPEEADLMPPALRVSELERFSADSGACRAALMARASRRSGCRTCTTAPAAIATRWS